MINIWLVLNLIIGVCLVSNAAWEKFKKITAEGDPYAPQVFELAPLVGSSKNKRKMSKEDTPRKSSQKKCLMDENDFIVIHVHDSE